MIPWKKNKRKKNQLSLPTVMRNVDGPNISVNEVVNISLGEGQLSVLFNSEPDWKSLAFAKNFSTGENHFNTERKKIYIPSRYLHDRLKCCDVGLLQLHSIYLKH